MNQLNLFYNVNSISYTIQTNIFKLLQTGVTAANPWWLLSRPPVSTTEFFKDLKKLYNMNPFNLYSDHNFNIDELTNISHYFKVSIQDLLI